MTIPHWTCYFGGFMLLLYLCKNNHFQLVGVGKVVHSQESSICMLSSNDTEFWNELKKVGIAFFGNLNVLYTKVVAQSSLCVQGSYGVCHL
jgi:hypothetical protein